MIYGLIALGSNIGDKKSNIKNAYAELENNNITIISKSSIYINPPYGFVNQEDFANSVILVKFDYSPKELLNILKKIEKKLGRYETFHWGPRVIDLDIILYDNIFYFSDNLTIPHNDYKNRYFVLEPMKEILNEILLYNINI